MPEEFSDIVSAAYDAQLAAGDPGETPAAPPPAATTDSGQTADNATATGEGSAQQGQQETAADEFANWQQIIDGDPALTAKAKALQGDYTRKMQELAEQRRAFDAQQQEIAGLVALQQLAQTDPAQAAQWAQQWAAELTGGWAVGQQKPETDPYSQYEPATPLEGVLLEKVRQLEQQSQEWTQFQQQQQAEAQQRAGAERMAQQFAQIESAIGRPLAGPERDQVIAHALQHGINNVVAAYRDLHWETEIGRAKQSGRDEASTIVQQKALAPGAPSAIVSRAPANAPKTYANDREMIADLLDQQLAEAG